MLVLEVDLWIKMVTHSVEEEFSIMSKKMKANTMIQLKSFGQVEHVYLLKPSHFTNLVVLTIAS